MTKLSEIKPKAVKVKLDRERTLQYNLNALALIEEKYGDIQKAAELVNEGKISVLRTVLWAGLIYEDKALTELQVGDMVDITNLEAIAEAIGQAFGAAVPEQKEEGKN